MSVYSIDWDAFLSDYLPPNKREPQTLAWLKAVFLPLAQLHQDTFVTFKAYIEDRAKHNGQRIVMESILNAFFNVPGPNLIYIDNSGDDKKGNLFFNESEGLEPVTLYNQSEGQAPFYFVNESEITNNRNFVVYVPSATYTSAGEDAIMAEVDRLKPYGTFYTIVQY